MRVQDRLNDVLQAGALAYDLVATRDLPAQRLGWLVSDPDLGQKAAETPVCGSRAALFGGTCSASEQARTRKLNNGPMQHVGVNEGGRVVLRSGR